MQTLEISRVLGFSFVQWYGYLIAIVIIAIVIRWWFMSIDATTSVVVLQIPP